MSVGVINPFSEVSIYLYIMRTVLGMDVLSVLSTGGLI